MNIQKDSSEQKLKSRSDVLADENLIDSEVKSKVQTKGSSKISKKVNDDIDLDNRPVF